MEKEKSAPTSTQKVDNMSAEPERAPAPPPAEQLKTTAPVARQDEDESDWEELDDVLDHFSASPKRGPSSAPPKQDQPTTQQQQQEMPNLVQLPEPDEEALIRQLEAGMAELLGGGGGAGGHEAGTETGEDGDDWNALAQELAKNGMQPADLMKLMMGEDITAADTEAGKDKSGKPEEGFQETIRKTMERMQESGDKATAAVNDSAEEDVLVQMLKAMEAAGMGGDGQDDDENIEKMLMGMMENLSNKEILYEPVKELDEKFGPWLKENKGKLAKEEYERYEKQAGLMADVRKKFDEPGYTDDNPEHRAYIWEKMQEMQSTGSPPKELVSEPFPDDMLRGDGPQCPQQ
ncbi:Peroxisome chaperone and import receptor [Emydomyces testavorans]|uniref:Peroxisome chaperone and import receptor n=1 Tax=Emydomyces testavorans TaxID=2070801 RepID=A0AAF0DBV9_9EURO|nr:Peroxisome chaperone and import receptor [Emydomyces testavorans]